MTVLGTGVAAGVAQTGLQAQQVARTRDQGGQSSAADAKRVRDMIELHLRALEEGDEQQDTPAKLRIDGQPPQQDTRHEQSKDRQPNAHATPEPEAAAADPGATPPQPPTPDSPLYRHLDVQA